MNFTKKITLILISAIIIFVFGVGITGAYVVSKRNFDNNSSQNSRLARNNSNTQNKPEPIENPDIFGDYMRNMQKKIKLNWNPPSETHSNKVVLIFKINKDGQVPDYKVLNSSGDNAVDSAAIDALLKSAPFEPLPTSYKGKDVQVQFAFDYNVYKNRKPPFKN